MNTLFVTCPLRLENLLRAELEALGFQDVKESYGGVYVKDGSLDAVYKINYCSSLASRVLLPLHSWRLFDAESLYRGAAQIDWRPYFDKGQTLAVAVSGSHRSFSNRMYAAQVCKDAICDQLRESTGERPSVERKRPDVQLHLFLNQREAHLSLDTSGAPLHERGYRKVACEAPLRENIAAALLACAQYTGEQSICDPCCGSGTILMEAALLASRTPPGFFRTRFGFESLPGFDQRQWHRVKEARDSLIRPIEHPLIGIDSSHQALEAARVNLQVFPQCELVEGGFDRYQGEQTKRIVTNPPHGKRLSASNALYGSLGAFLKRQCTAGGLAAVLCADPDLARCIGLAPRKERKVESGGLSAVAFVYKIFHSRLDTK